MGKKKETKKRGGRETKRDQSRRMSNFGKRLEKRKPTDEKSSNHLSPVDKDKRTRHWLNEYKNRGNKGRDSKNQRSGCGDQRVRQCYGALFGEGKGCQKR